MADIKLPLIFGNRHTIAKQLAVHDVIFKRLASIQAMQTGMDEMHIIKLIRKNPGIRSALVFKAVSLDFDMFIALIATRTYQHNRRPATYCQLSVYVFACC